MLNYFCVLEPLKTYQLKGISFFVVERMRDPVFDWDDGFWGFPFLIENSYFSLKYVRIKNVLVVRFC